MLPQTPVSYSRQKNQLVSSEEMIRQILPDFGPDEKSVVPRQKICWCAAALSQIICRVRWFPDLAVGS